MKKSSQHPSLPAFQQSKIRVVHLVYSFATGGMEKGICTTILHGSDEFEHIIVCLNSSGEMAKRLPGGVPVFEMKKGPGNSIKFIFRLAKLLKSLQPAVIHTRNWSGIDGIFAARLAGIRSIVHGEHGWGMEDPLGLNTKRRIFRRIADRVTHRYTCVSKQMNEWLAEHIYVKRPIDQIYNGIDIQAFRPAMNSEKIAIRRKFGIPEEGPIIGVVARLDPIKNHPCLFDAFNQLKPLFPKLTLLVVGDGPEREKLEGIATEGITFMGQCNDTASAYRAFDLFVLPSHNEGISNTILEAMATGLPVVASRVGGNPELIEDGVNGTLFSSGDVSDLANRIYGYLKNPKLAYDHGKCARELAESRFSIDNMVVAYEKVWKNTWLKSGYKSQ